MKKLLGLIILLLVVGSTIAQKFTSPPVQYNATKMTNNYELKTPNIPSQNYPTRATGVTHSDWINVPYFISQYLGDTWTTSSNLMAPDTFIKIRYDKVVTTPAPHYEFEYIYNNWCSVGLTYTPNNSTYIPLDSLWQNQSYSVDSVGIFYSYTRFGNTYPKLVNGYVYYYTHNIVEDSLILNGKTGTDSTFLSKDILFVTYHSLKDTLILTSKTGSSKTIVHGDQLILKDQLNKVTDTITVISKTGSPDSIVSGQKLIFNIPVLVKDSILKAKYVQTPVVDTLVLQIYTGKQGNTTNIFPYTYIASKKPAFAIIGYDRTRGIGKNADYTMTMLLTKGDSIPFQRNIWDIMYFALPKTVTMANGGPIAMSWTFKPGVDYGTDYKTGDTLPLAKYDSVKVFKPVNAFFWGAYFDRVSSTVGDTINEFTNGNLINFQQRYSDWSTNFPSDYLPGALWSYPLYPVGLFKITYTAEEQPLSINDKVAGISASLYPNPLITGNNLKLNFNLTNSNHMIIDVYDLVGQKLSTVVNGNYVAGNHSIDMNTSDLAPGVYFCRISSDNFSKSIKFVINR